MSRRRPNRRRWWLLLLAVLAAVVLWLLPTILASTPLLGWAIRSATADLRGRMAVRAASLGWFSPVRLSGVTIHDDQNRPVVEVQQVETEYSLLGLATAGSRLGGFRIVDPKIAVTLRGDGSNIEDVLAEYLKPAEEPTAAPHLRIEVVNGSVTITDVVGARTWHIGDWQLTLDLPANALTDAGAPPVELSTSGKLDDPKRPGRFDLNGRVPLTKWMALIHAEHPGETNHLPASTAELSAEALPLALFEPLMRRLWPTAELSGMLAGEFSAAVGTGGGLQAVSQTGEGDNAADALRATMAMTDFRFRAPPLGEDRIELARVALDVRGDGTPRHWEVERASLESDVGDLSISGTIDPLGLITGSDWRRLTRQPVDVQGTIDVARLAELLPRTLHIREQTRITSGQVKLAIQSTAGTSGIGWQGRLETSELKATDRGRPLRWEQPILLTAAAHQAEHGVVIDKLSCRSDFLTLDAVGNPTDFVADASFDLSRLATQLGQFVELGDLRLSGEGWSHITWKLAGQERFESEAELHVANLQIALPDRPPWHEQKLLALITASGSTVDGQVARLDAARLTVEASREKIDLWLREPATEMRVDRTWPIAVKARGELADWPARLAMFADLSTYRPAGHYQIQANADVSTAEVRLLGSDVQVKPLRLTAGGINVDEPEARAELIGTWKPGEGTIALERALLQAVSAAIESNNLQVTLPPNAPFALAGKIAYRAYLARLQQALQLGVSEAGPVWRMDGEMTGVANFEQTARLTTGTIEANVDGLRIIGQSGAPFYEHRVGLTAEGTFDNLEQLITLTSYDLASDTLDSQGRATLALAHEPAEVDFAARMQYDMAQISALLEPYIGSGVALAGRGDTPVAIRGPLDLERLQGSAELHWDRGELYGFQLGTARIKTSLARGVLSVAPVAVRVNRGQARLQPSLRLAPDPMLLKHPKENLITKVDITPQMCAGALKFIAPVLAGVTSADGQFSIELDKCDVPLDDPKKGVVAGRLIVHAVRIGAGPLTEELATVLGYGGAAQLERESTIPFRMANGRVHHENLGLVFPDVTLRTAGSVGFDQSIKLVVEMPIPQRWIPKGGAGPVRDLVGSALKDQTIHVGIGGTLYSPQIDQAALRRLNQQFLERASRNIIEDQIGRGLDRLFGPPER